MKANKEVKNGFNFLQQQQDPLVDHIYAKAVGFYQLVSPYLRGKSVDPDPAKLDVHLMDKIKQQAIGNIDNSISYHLDSAHKFGTKAIQCLVRYQEFVIADLSEEEEKIIQTTSEIVLATHIQQSEAVKAFCNYIQAKCDHVSNSYNGVKVEKIAKEYILKLLSDNGFEKDPKHLIHHIQEILRIATGLEDKALHEVMDLSLIHI